MVDGLVGDFLGRCLGWVTGFHGIGVGLSGFLWDAGSFLLFFFWLFLGFFLMSGGLRGSEPWGWLWIGFPWLSSKGDFRYIMIWYTIFLSLLYGLGDGAT